MTRPEPKNPPSKWGPYYDAAAANDAVEIPLGIRRRAFFNIRSTVVEEFDTEEPKLPTTPGPDSNHNQEGRSRPVAPASAVVRPLLQWTTININ